MNVTEYFRQIEPRFNEVPDDQLVEFIVRSQPEFLQDKQFRNQTRSLFGQQANVDSSRDELRTDLADSYNPLLSTAIGRAATRGAAQLGANTISADDALVAFGRRFGLHPNPITETIKLGARSLLQGGESIPTEGPDSLADVHSASDLGALALEKGIGEQLPQFVGTAVTGGLGALAGLSPKAAAIFGIIATTFPQETGGAFEEIKQRTGKEAPVTAAAVGAVNSFLETLGDAKLFERVLGGDRIIGATVGKLIQALAKRTVVQGAKEAGTEAAQELVTALTPEAFGAQRDPALFNRVGTAGALGAVGGLGFGGAVDVAQIGQDFTTSTAPTAEDLARRQQYFALQDRQRQLIPTGYTPLGFNAPSPNEEQLIPQAPVLPDQIGLNTAPDLAAPGAVPPFPSSALPITQTLLSSATPEDLTALPGIGFDRRRDLAVRPAQLDTPILDPGIQIEPTLASEAAAVRVRAQQEALTREQREAQALLVRLAGERQQSIEQAQVLEQQGRTDLANLAFANGIARRVDLILQQKVQARGPVANLTPAPLVQTEQGLTDVPQGTIAPSPVDIAVLQQQAAQTAQPVVVPPVAQPVVRTAQPETRRQRGETLNLQVTPERAQALQEMSALSDEETARAQQTDSNGTPTGTPETNAGRLLQEFLYAPRYIEQQAARQGIQLDAEAAANLERRYQEIAMDAYARANASQLALPQLFSRRTAFRGALADTASMRNTAGTLRGAVVPTEITTESGTVVNSEVERAAQPETRPYDEDEMAVKLGDFLGQFPSMSERSAAMNLIAKYGNYPRPDSKPNARRDRFEADPALQAKVQAFVKTLPPLPDIRNSLAQQIGTPLSVAEVTGFAQGVVADMTKVSVINDPTADYRAQYRPGEAQPFVLNAAFLGSEQDVREALLEELMHGVFTDPAVQAAWAEVTGSLTPQDLSAVQDYPQAVQQEEAAIRKVIDQINSRQVTSPVRKFINAVIDAVKRLFGVTTKADAYDTILARALQAQVAESHNSPEETASGRKAFDIAKYSSTDTLGDTVLDLKKLSDDIRNGVEIDGPIQRALFQHLSSKIGENPISRIRILTDRSSLDYGFQGKFTTYIGKRDALIQIVSHNARGTDLSESGFLRILNHELLHNAVTSKLDIVPTDLRRNFERLYGFAKEQAKGTALEAVNAFKNLHEFVADGLSSKKVREFLLSLDYSNGVSIISGYNRDYPDFRYKASAFGRLLELTRRLLGIDQQVTDPYTGRSTDAITALDQLVYLSDTVEDYSRPVTGYLEVMAPVDEGGFVRNSLARGLWKNSADLARDEAGAGDPGTLRAAASAQANVLPQQYADEVNNLGTTPAELVTKRLLEPITSVRAMGEQLANTFSIDPYSINLGNTFIPVSAADIAAEAMIKQQLALQNLDQKTEKNLGELAKKLSDAVGRQFPERMMAQNKVDIYRSMTDRSVDEYRRYINVQSMLNTQTFDAQIKKDLDAASDRMTGDYQQVANSVANGLRQIAAEIPSTALATAEATQAWIGQRLDDNRAPRLMSDTARDWLVQPIGRQLPPLIRDKRIHLRLKAVQQLALGNQQAIDDIKSLKASLGGSPEKFARKWSALRTKYSEALNTVREIDRTIDRLEAQFEGTERAQEILRRMLSDPAYQAPVDEGVQHLQAGTNLKVYGRNEKKGAYTGNIDYTNPLTGKIISINLQPDVGLEAANLQKIQQLRADVVQWMGTTTDRVLRASWEKEDDFLQRYAFGLSPTLVTGMLNLGGYRVPSMFQWTPFGRELTAGYIDVRAPAYNRIGNRLMQPVQQMEFVSSQADRAIRVITENFERKTKEAAKAAVESHGWTSDRSTVLGQWNDEVYNPLVSQYQNPTAKPYVVGDWINGVQLTKEDFAAVEAYKARDRAMFDLLQKAEEDSKPLLYFHPLQTAEHFLNQPISRLSVDYGWKMSRRPLSRLNERGRTFTADWIEAGKVDDPNNKAQVAAASAKQRALLEKAYDWVLMSNGLLLNTDKEFDPRWSKEDAPVIVRIQKMARENTMPFTNLDELIDWVGQQQATPTRTAADASTEFERRLRSEVDKFTRAFDRVLNIVPVTTAAAFLKLGLPVGIIDTVGVGESPFLTPRGSLVAPPSFYTYSTVDDQAWGALTAGARVALTLREIEALSAAQAALASEIQRYEAKDTGLIAQEQLANPSRNNPFSSAKRRVARKSKAMAEAGDLLYDLRLLKAHARAVDRQLTQLKRVASEHITHPEDSELIQAIRSGRQAVVSSVLTSPLSIAGNATGGTVSLMLYRRGLGKWSFLNSAISIPATNARYIFDAVVSKVSKMKGMDPAVRAALKTPGVRRLTEFLLNEALRWEQDRRDAIQAGLIDEPSAADRAAIAKLFPDTGGRLSDDDPSALSWLINQAMSRTPGLKRGLEEMKSKFPGAVDRMINQGIIRNAREWTEALTPVLNSLWAARDTGTVGWDDLARPINRFTGKELGLNSDTSVTFWRQMLSSVGSLESLALDQYKRSKASGQIEPLLSSGQIQSVANEIARMTNMASAGNTPLISQGRGLPGEARKTLAMLTRYIINFNAVNENFAGKNYGDNSNQARLWRTGSIAVALVLAVALTSLGKELGQETREWFLGEPRTTASLKTVLTDPSGGDLVRYMATSIASVAPFIGERIAQAYGGTSNRPLLDTTRIFAPLGLAADLEQTIMRILQSGDLTYPLADLMRRYSPLSAGVINRVLPGEQESREALRAVRLAAPTDIEQRQSGGGASRQTPQTPLIREAVGKALSGDTAGSQEALNKAVALKVAAGQDAKSARQAVMSSFNSRDPEISVFGRRLQADERRRVLARMSSGQASAFNRARSVFEGTRSRTRARKLRLSSTRRRRKRLLTKL